MITKLIEENKLKLIKFPEENLLSTVVKNSMRKWKTGMFDLDWIPILL